MADDEVLGGAEIRRRIMGNQWVDDTHHGDGGVEDHFTEVSIDHVWRAFWARPGLELRLRSVVTLTALTSLEAHGELEAHVRGALRNGWLTRDEIREVVLHATPYIGFPRARHALMHLQPLLDGEVPVDPPASS